MFSCEEAMGLLAHCQELGVLCEVSCEAFPWCLSTACFHSMHMERSSRNIEEALRMSALLVSQLSLQVCPCSEHCRYTCMGSALLKAGRQSDAAQGDLLFGEQMAAAACIPDAAKLYCPFKDCSSLMQRDEACDAACIECPACHRSICPRYVHISVISWSAESRLAIGIAAASAWLLEAPQCLQQALVQWSPVL